jgi:xanthine dehydrogenase small subunit
MLRFVLNNGAVEVATHPGLPALDYLRDTARLTGVKHACREGDCGSCVILLGRTVVDAIRYQVVTSCLLPMGAVAGRHLVTVEGLNSTELGPFQRAIASEGGSQCGFCTPGFVVAFTGHLLETEHWSVEPAIEAVAGNICRCTGYASIRRAMAEVLGRLRKRVDPAEDRVPALVREGLLPDYFLDIGNLLAGLGSAALQPRAASQRVVAGGTDLYVQRPDELATGDVWVLPVETERPVWRDGDHIYLAPTATAEDMKRSPLLNEAVGDLDRAMTLMGSLPIRHRATIAGNIVNASPIGDMTIILLALDSDVGLVGGEHHRSLPLREFFQGYKLLDLRPGELVEWVRFLAPKEGSVFNFEKVSKRTHLDIASVNSAVSLHIDNGRITAACLSAGGIAPIPTQLKRAAAFLLGRVPDAETARLAASLAREEVAPISDVRGSADYKRLLLGQLVLAHFNVLFGLEADLVEEAAG